MPKRRERMTVKKSGYAIPFMGRPGKAMSQSKRLVSGWFRVGRPAGRYRKGKRR